MLPWVSPSGPPQRRGWGGSQWGSWASCLHLSCLNQSCSHEFCILRFFFPLMFYLLLRESAESGFMGSEDRETSAHYFVWLWKGGKLCKDVSHVFKENDLIGCGLSRCLFWSLVGCLWLVVPKFFLGSECIDSGLGLGLWVQTAKALEPPQPHGLLI